MSDEPEDEEGEARAAMALHAEQLRRRSQRPSLRRTAVLLKQAVGLARAADGGGTAVVVLGAVVAAVAVGAQVLLARTALGGLLARGGNGIPTRTAVALIAMGASTALAGAVNNVVTARQRVLAERVSQRSWDETFAVTTSVPLLTFESTVFHDQLRRVQIAAFTRPITVVTGLVSTVSGGLGLLAVTAALLRVDPVLVLVLFLGAVPLLVTQRRSGAMEYAFSLDQSPLLRRRLALSEVLTGRGEAKEVRAGGSAPLLRRWHDEMDATHLVALRAHVRRKLRLTLLTALISAVTGAVALGLLLLLVHRGDVSVAAAGSAAVAVALLGGRLSSLATGVASLLESALFLEDMAAFTALGVPQDAVGAAGTVPAPDDAPPGIVLDDVTFTYPGASRPALTDVTATFAPGRVTALVGENGSGKTTLSKLVAGLYPATAGVVTWDGADVAGLSDAVRRRRMAVVFQDFVRYELPARANIGIGDPARIDDHEAVVAAAALMGVDGVLADLPAGWETILSGKYAGGADLSLGQWQRVALARAAFRDAPLVILDEPTASLDPRAEAALFAQIRTLFAGRTVLLVTHRFASARSADHIVVLQQGHVVEQGDHETLMAGDGLYAELYGLQARGLLGEPPAADGGAADGAAPEPAAPALLEAGDGGAADGAAPEPAAPALLEAPPRPSALEALRSRRA